MINLSSTSETVLSSYQKLSKCAQLGILRNIPTKFEVNPFSSLGIIARTKNCKLTYSLTPQLPHKIS